MEAEKKASRQFFNEFGFKNLNFFLWSMLAWDEWPCVFMQKWTPRSFTEFKVEW